MSPTLDFLNEAEKHLRHCLEAVRPKLLEAQGNIEHHLKDDNSAVTEMDTFVESELAKALKKIDSSIPFGGEEGGVDFDKPTYWLVDPIDGTEPFIRGMPFATNMISLIDRKESIFAVIYNFNIGDFYVAIKGHGATCNGHPIHVSNRPPNRAWITFSATTGKPGTYGLGDRLNQQVLSVRRYGAGGYDYTMVASGALEGRVAFNGHGHEWDFAPGTLLVKEAGGMVANINSSTYDFRNYDHIAANPVVFDTLMKFMSQIDHDAKNTAT